MTTKYNLTPKELRNLKTVCTYAGLRWQAQAARPKLARFLITDYLVEAQDHFHKLASFRNAD